MIAAVAGPARVNRQGNCPSRQALGVGVAVACLLVTGDTRTEIFRRVCLSSASGAELHSAAVEKELSA